MFSKWIVALPDIAEDKAEIAKKYGFISYPEFHDNFYVYYVRFKTINFRKIFLKHFIKNEKKIKFVVYPDYQYDMKWLIKTYNDKQWIFPLHKKKEFDFILKNEIEWVGFPHRNLRFPKTLWGDYTLQEYLDFCGEHGLKKWYLGFWLESKPEILLRFNGLDTTIPEYYAGKCGKIWLSWNKTVKPQNMKTNAILEKNIINLKKALLKLQQQLLL